MKILGIYDDHNCCAALMIDGKIVEAINEERFTGLKNDTGFPKNAVDYIFNKYSLSNKNLDLIGFSGTNLEGDIQNYCKINTFFSVRDHKKFMKEYWEKKLNNVEYNKDLIKKIMINKENLNTYKSYYLEETKLNNANDDLLNFNHEKNIYSLLDRYYSIDPNKVKFVDHHLCHLSHAYQSWPKKNLFDTIGVTVDAWGDKRNQTVWKVLNSKYELLAESDQCELARIYRMVTLYLGMLPLQHEYKVMGLAPYAKKKHSYEIKEFLNTIIELDNLKFKHKNRPKDLYKYLEDNLQNYRFDNIARGLQDFVEENLVNLFRNIYKQTGINKFVYAGGVAMNVKANKVLHEQDFVEDLFVPGSPDDQGTCLGVCYELARKNKINTNSLNHYYLGNLIDDKNSVKIVHEYTKKSKFRISTIEDISIDEIIDLLIQGQIVARASGKMEFGSRALGNRSIFANPSIEGVIKQINQTIKNRDFWMPFAGTVCEELVSECLVNPKNIDGSFMTIAFSSTDNINKFKAASHSYDQTIRAQILSKEQNPWYHELIMRFFEKTKIPILLNTSLNIHGKPIVNDEIKALDLFENTSIKHMIIGNTLLSKKL